MTAMNWLRGRWLLGAVGVGLLSVGAAVAEVPNERPGSLLLFPKVVNTATRTTVIELSSTNNLIETVRCYYVDPECRSIDFDLFLTRQQPTSWRVESGRSFKQSGGFFPGLIPPVPFPFVGALVCASVDPGAAHTVILRTDKLKGRATLEDTGGGNESIYNGIPVHSQVGDGTPDNIASLDGDEFEECPADLHLDTFARAPAPDPVIGENGTVSTGLTLMSCDLDLERNSGGSFNLLYKKINEFEQPISKNSSGKCLYFASLDDIFGSDVDITPYTAVSVRATDGGAPTGVVGIAEYFHIDVSPPSPRAATAARTLHDVTEEYPSTEIVLH